MTVCCWRDLRIAELFGSTRRYIGFLKKLRFNTDLTHIHQSTTTSDYAADDGLLTKFVKCLRFRPTVTLSNKALPLQSRGRFRPGVPSENAGLTTVLDLQLEATC